VTQPASVGPYEILGQLGHGTTGIIYKARHPIQRDRFVALKTPCLAPEPAARWRGTCFMAECYLLALLTHEPSPYFASLYDVGAGVPEHPLGYYAREFVDGGTLEQWATGGAWTLRTGITDHCAKEVKFVGE
jgi:serine/threonine protein kinase